METRSVKVKIFGTEYPLRGESEEMTKQVAKYVDDMIHNVHEKIPEQSPLTIAVLSALNITEELFRERQQKNTLPSEMNGEVQQMIRYLDSCLQ
ncbi:MAG: cell division protein ZapA [Ignavibacteriales bacterium]|nr:cell division protein ZapA [Ignavibacteriales bacterium]